MITIFLNSNYLAWKFDNMTISFVNLLLSQNFYLIITLLPYFKVTYMGFSFLKRKWCLLLNLYLFCKQFELITKTNYPKGHGFPTVSIHLCLHHKLLLPADYKQFSRIFQELENIYLWEESTTYVNWDYSFP